MLTAEAHGDRIGCGRAGGTMKNIKKSRLIKSNNHMYAIVCECIRTVEQRLGRGDHDNGDHDSYGCASTAK